LHPVGRKCLTNKNNTTTTTNSDNATAAATVDNVVSHTIAKDSSSCVRGDVKIVEGISFSMQIRLKMHK
jgi:hypothetical protein